MRRAKVHTIGGYSAHPGQNPRPPSATRGRILLAHAPLERFARDPRKPRRGFSADAIRAIEAYDGPGNVRELENVIGRAVIMADGPRITPEDLGLEAPAEEPKHRWACARRARPGNRKP